MNVYALCILLLKNIQKKDREKKIRGNNQTIKERFISIFLDTALTRISL